MSQYLYHACRWSWRHYFVTASKGYKQNDAIGNVASWNCFDDVFSRFDNSQTDAFRADCSALRCFTVGTRTRDQKERPMTITSHLYGPILLGVVATKSIQWRNKRDILLIISVRRTELDYRAASLSLPSIARSAEISYRTLLELASPRRLGNGHHKLSVRYLPASSLTFNPPRTCFQRFPLTAVSYASEIYYQLAIFFRFKFCLVSSGFTIINFYQYLCPFSADSGFCNVCLLITSNRLMRIPISCYIYMEQNWDKTETIKHWNSLKQFQACFSLISIFIRILKNMLMRLKELSCFRFLYQFYFRMCDGL